MRESGYDETGCPTGTYSTYEYDAEGTLLREKGFSGRGDKINYMYEYDAVGNCVRETWYNLDGTVNKVYEYN